MSERCQCGAVAKGGSFCQYCGADHRTSFERNVDRVTEATKPALEQVKTTARTVFRLVLIIGIIIAVIMLVIVVGAIIYVIKNGVPELNFKLCQALPKLLQTTLHR